MQLYALYHKKNSERIYERKDISPTDSFQSPIDRVQARNPIQARIKFLRKRKEKFSDFQEKYVVKKITVPASVDKKQFFKAFNEGDNPFQKLPEAVEVTTLQERKNKRSEKIRQEQFDKYERIPNEKEAARVALDNKYILDRLPESYRKATLTPNQSSVCKGCIHYAASKCRQWDAPVKTDYVCDSYEAAEVRLTTEGTQEREFVPFDEAALNAKSKDPALLDKIKEDREQSESNLKNKRRKGLIPSTAERKEHKKNKSREQLERNLDLKRRFENGTLTEEEEKQFKETKRRQKRDKRRKRFITPDQERKQVDTRKPREGLKRRKGGPRRKILLKRQ